jgi:hypothetical protein
MGDENHEPCDRVIRNLTDKIIRYEDALHRIAGHHGHANTLVSCHDVANSYELWASEALRYAPR